MFLSTLISVSDPCVVKNDFDLIFNACIDVMIMLSRNLGVTYGTANVVLFVILMPLIIVLFLGRHYSNEKICSQRYVFIPALSLR